MKGIICLVAVVLVSLCLGGCVSSRDVAYLQDVGSNVRKEGIARMPVKVQSGDKISIVVNSKNPELAEMFNLPVVTRRVGQPVNGSYNYNQQVSSYTVDSNGNIDFPVLGELRVEGLTREKIASYIKNELVRKNLVKDAVVIVEFMNMGISVMGEVNKPGRFAIDRDHLTLLDAISLAGDLTIYGKRENVLVARRENGGETYYRVDLCDSKSLHSSPVYYLKQNDVVYVEPNDVRARQSTLNGNNVRTTSFWMSLASLLTTLGVLIFK